jgi:hypothetical protein
MAKIRVPASSRSLILVPSARKTVRGSSAREKNKCANEEVLSIHTLNDIVFDDDSPADY